MKGINFNLSSLFNNMTNNNILGSFNFSDYASIKNGSYGKAVKSYYAEKNQETKGKPSTSSKKDVETDSTGLSQAKTSADSLKSAVEELGKEDLWKQTGGEYDKEKIIAAVKSFVKEYNSAIAQAGKVTSKDVNQNLGYMKSLTSTMTKTLSKAGITVEPDGKLYTNDTQLGKANLNTMKSLFTGTVSYGSQTADKAAEISKAAVMSSSVYSGEGKLNNSLATMFDLKI